MDVKSDFKLNSTKTCHEYIGQCCITTGPNQVKSFISGNTAHRKTKKEIETDINTETHSASQADRRTDRQN